MIAFIVLGLLIILTLYLYGKNNKKCNHKCNGCKGCDL